MEGKKKREKPKKWSFEIIEKDMKSTSVCEKDVKSRGKQKVRIRVADYKQLEEKAKKRKRINKILSNVMLTNQITRHY